LFNSLPDEYQHFVTSFCISSRNETPTFEEVVGLLLQEEQRLKKNELAPDRAFSKLEAKFFKSDRYFSKF
jgi:hypothetical protein